MRAEWVVEVAGMRKRRQVELNEAVLEGRSDAPSRTASVLALQRALTEGQP